jgi:hypothetical protein
MTNLSSPNRIVWEYFEALRRLVVDSRDAEDESTRRQSAALALVMSVTVVEVFFNLWFRVRAEERHSPAEVALLISELGHPRPWSLDRKLRHWPKRYLGKELDLTQGPGAEFLKIKALRNSIVHFSSSHTTFEHDNVVIRGLADTTDYDELSFEKARSALFAAEDVIGEVFILAGIAPENVRHMLHGWAGRVPI